MRIPRFSCFIFALLIALLAERDICGQWVNVAPNIVSPKSNGRFGYGGMCYKDGKIMAAPQGTPICISSDDGTTWKLVAAPYGDDEPFDLNVFDKNNAIIATYKNGIYNSKDGGNTWGVINPGSFISGKFGNSAQDIIVSEYGGAIQVSHDAGINWQQITPPFFKADNMQIVKDFVIYSLELDKGNISYTKDGGLTWTETSSFDFDCYEFALDPCDKDAFYIINEGDVRAGTDGLTHIFYTYDNGLSFHEVNSRRQFYYSGNIIAAPKGTLYVQTQTPDGILRSTDRGLSWKSIGGPFGNSDTHLICCKDDNTIFAFDSNGSIWATFNSGGDSLTSFPYTGILSLSQKILFAKDSVVCNNITHFIKFSAKGCFPPQIIKSEIIGIDSSSYSIIPVAGDSIGVNFNPQNSGQQNANLILFLSDGTFDTISLQGYGITPHQLSCKTSNQSTDTIGGFIYLPISISGLPHPEDIELVIHYDKDLKYDGSFSKAMQLDMNNEQWVGRSKLHIAQAKPDVISGFAEFEVFGDSTSLHVTFDSMIVLTAIAPCEYILPAAVTATITPPSGCGVQTLTRFLLDSSLPQLSIIPNPTSGEISITSSRDLGTVSIAIYDMLGAKRTESAALLGKNSPAKVFLPSANGVYYVRVNYGINVTDLRVVVNH